MSAPVPNNNVPSGGAPGGQGVGGPGGPQEQTWWRADIRTFIMNLWFIILLAFGFFQSIILNILTTPPNEWGTRLTQVFNEDDSYFSATYSQLIGFVVLVLVLFAGSLQWWFTRYHLDELAIHRRSGIFFKKERTIRLESVQSVDISRPLVVRLLGLSELRFEVADGSGEALHIKYLSRAKGHPVASCGSAEHLDSAGSGQGSPGRLPVGCAAPLGRGFLYPLGSACIPGSACSLDSVRCAPARRIPVQRAPARRLAASSCAVRLGFRGLPRRFARSGRKLPRTR